MRAVVNVDASYRDGEAGIAMVGTLGQHACFIHCSSSQIAEMYAIAMALHMAEHKGVASLLVRTDAKGCVHLKRKSYLNRHPTSEHGLMCKEVAMMLAHREGWQLSYVSRTNNKEANALARQARRAGPCEPDVPTMYVPPLPDLPLPDEALRKPREKKPPATAPGDFRSGDGRVLGLGMAIFHEEQARGREGMRSMQRRSR